MKKCITIIAAALALLTLTGVSNAAAPTVSGGVLVRNDDGYIITGTLRDAVDSRVVGTAHGTLIERTTGFNTCADIEFDCSPFFGGADLSACNLLGGEVTFNFQGVKYFATVGTSLSGRVDSSLCLDPDNPTTYRLFVSAFSFTHTTPGEFPDFFVLAGTVEQITPTLFKWSGG